MKQRNWLTRLLTRLLNKLFGFDQMAEEYIDRFIRPKWHKLIERGLTPEQADELVTLALKYATPENFAGARLNLALDALDAGWPFESVRGYLTAGKLRPLPPEPPPAEHPPGFINVT